MAMFEKEVTTPERLASLPLASVIVAPFRLAAEMASSFTLEFVAVTV